MVQNLFNPDPSVTYLMGWWSGEWSKEVNSLWDILMSTCFSLLLWDAYFLVWLTSSFRILWSFLKQKLLRNVILLHCKVRALAWSGLIYDSPSSSFAIHYTSYSLFRNAESIHSLEMSLSLLFSFGGLYSQFCPYIFTFYSIYFNKIFHRS
jgi:hypothetical protein